MNDTEYRRTAFNQRNRNRVYDEVISRLREAVETNNISRAQIAEKSGKKPQSLSRLLSGPGNWTLDTVSDLLFAIDAEMDYNAVFFSEKEAKKSNEFHPLSDPNIYYVNTSETAQPGTKQSAMIDVKEWSENAEAQTD